MNGRPYPPTALAEESRSPAGFAPAHDLAAWIRNTFIETEGPLCNADHAHLAFAHLGVLWTNIENQRNQRPVAGQAEAPRAQGGMWVRARADHLLRSWFGTVPDFLITLDSVYCAQAEDAAFCALVEHELYHCGQAQDAFGSPRYTKYGLPVFAIRGHDVEEFVGVVRRYGAGASASGVADMVRAAAGCPQVAAAEVSLACGTCLRPVGI